MAVRKRENTQKNKKLVKRENIENKEQQASSNSLKYFIALFALFVFIYLRQSPAAPVAKSTSRFQSGPAIVTTWKGVSREWAESWISYHAALGFTRLFIFWDAPENDKETIAWLNSDSAYSWVVDNYEPNEDYKKRYWMPNNESEDFEQWVLPAYGVHAETEITARQSLFAARAAQIGLAEGVSWLLHIDADELFWVDEKEASGSAKRIFNTLSEKRFTHASFMNDEILPETPNFENSQVKLLP